MKQIISILNILFIISLTTGKAQSFAPGAGFAGSTAVYKDSSIFIDWANSAETFSSYMNVAFPENGYVSFGTNTCAIGVADGNEGVISLGDGGYAVLSFEFPLTNGEGNDFAVFENGFYENDTSENAFLELAFIEVSTDGEEFVLFPAVSELQTDSQISSFGYINSRYIHNLAGKYTMYFGTPFDLEDISDFIEGTTVDLNNINYIKIIDVVGSIDSEFARYDSEGNIINDPYPTAFISGGFDLDAVGVINNETNTKFENELSIRPNPVKDILLFKTSISDIKRIEIFSFDGKLQISTGKNSNINTEKLKPGIYILRISGNTETYAKKFVKL